LFNFKSSIPFGNEDWLLSNDALQSTKDVTKKSPSKIKFPKNFANKIKIFTIFNAKTFF
jgi:hypothetical protein